MTLQVVSARAAAPLSFPSLFELAPAGEGSVVILGGVLDDADLVRIPVSVQIEEQRLRIRAFDATLDLGLTRLIATGSGAAGYAVLSVEDRAGGARWLVGIARALQREPSVPRAPERQGPLSKMEVSLSAAPASGGVTLSIGTGSLSLRLAIPDRTSAAAELAFDPSALDEGWDDFARAWELSFRDGVMPRHTRADDPLLTDEAPWIRSARALEGASGARLSEAGFGGETLFAVRAAEASLRLVAWAPPFSGDPFELAELPASEVQLYPSPDGAWVAVVSTIPDAEGSVTDGASTLHLVHVETRSMSTLARKDPSIGFGDTGSILQWSEDGRRFVFSADLVVRGERSGWMNLVYDVELRSFVDVLEDDALVHGWDGDAVVVYRTTYRDDGTIVREGSRWTPGSGAAPEKNAALEDREEAFAGAHAITRDGLDTRVVAPGGGWRYLAARECGRPELFAPRGRGVLFRDPETNAWQVGVAALPPPPAPARITYPSPAPARRARASLRAGDEARFETALAEIPDAEAQRDLASLRDARRAAAAFARAAQAADREASLEPLEQAVRLDPAWSEPQARLVGALRSVGKIARMLEVATEWARRDPASGEAAMQRSIALQNLGRLEEATAAAREAASLEPAEGRMHYQLACVLSLTGQTDAALVAANEAASCEPALAPSIGADADLSSLRGHPGFAGFEAAALRMRGHRLYDADYLEEAAAAFRDSTKLEPTEGAYQNWMAIALRVDDAEALAAAEAWLAFRPHIAPFAVRCRLLLAADRNDEALAVAEEAVKTVPLEGGAVATFCRAFGRAKRNVECLAMLERVVEERPDVALEMMRLEQDLLAVREEPAFAVLFAKAEAGAGAS